MRTFGERTQKIILIESSTWLTVTPIWTTSMIFRQLLLLGAVHLLSSDGVTIDEVALHDSEDDCWSAVYGNVYDLTAFAPNHRKGGGPSVVYSMCGRDGTSLYDPVHGNDPDYLSIISSIVNIGRLVEATNSPPPEPTETRTEAPQGTITTHSTRSNAKSYAVALAGMHQTYHPILST